MREVLHEIGRVLRRWLVGQTLLAACVAFLTVSVENAEGHALR
jgi:predicted PurR-regulated permease PerM